MPVGGKEIQKMQEALVHRAVDGKGVWFSGNILLGHHKLAITPEQQTEQQPFEYLDFVITADARIDNRVELINQLKTEIPVGLMVNNSFLLLTAFRKWQEKCLEYIEGEFAFAIWNKRTKQLFCAVDHIGFRPLFYYDMPSVFVFSSEMKGILAVKETPNLFNDASLIEYFFRQSDLTKTHNDEIFALCGGNRLILQNGKVRIEKYWNPQPLGKYHFNKDEEWAECLRDLLFRSIGNRLHTNLPVGIGLSGGLDSSSVACIAGKILEKRNQTLYAFSSALPVGHKGIECDERRYIEIIGNHLKNLDQTYIEAREVGPFSNLEKTFSVDETFPNPFHYMDQAIYAAAREKRIGVFLSGFGGDFFVSDKGNEVIYELIRQFRFGEATGLLRQLKHQENKGYFSLFKSEFARHTKIGKSLISFRNKKQINWQRYSMLNDEFLIRHKQNINFDYISHPVLYMLDYLNSGRVGRVMGMWANRSAAYALETAVPLFDKQINEFMFDVPIEQYLKGGSRRSLIRRAMEGILPPEIQWRKDKQPYTPDFHSRVIKEKLFIDDILNSRSYNFAWKYIDKSKIAYHFKDIKPVNGMGNWMTIGGNQVVQGIVAVCFLQWLKKNGYNNITD